MTTRTAALPWFPGYGWWALLAIVLATAFATNWFIALGVLTFLMVQAYRPLDFMSTMLVVTPGATFVYYEGGNLTLQLSLLSAAIVLMLVCYALSLQPGKLA